MLSSVGYIEIDDDELRRRLMAFSFGRSFQHLAEMVDVQRGRIEEHVRSLRLLYSVPFFAPPGDVSGFAAFHADLRLQFLVMLDGTYLLLTVRMLEDYREWLSRTINHAGDRVTRRDRDEVRAASRVFRHTTDVRDLLAHHAQWHVGGGVDPDVGFEAFSESDGLRVALEGPDVVLRAGASNVALLLLARRSADHARALDEIVWRLLHEAGERTRHPARDA